MTNTPQRTHVAIRSKGGGSPHARRISPNISRCERPDPPTRTQQQSISTSAAPPFDPFISDPPTEVTTDGVATYVIKELLFCPRLEAYWSPQTEHVFLLARFIFGRKFWYESSGSWYFFDNKPPGATFGESLAPDAITIYVGSLVCFIDILVVSYFLLVSSGR